MIIELASRYGCSVDLMIQVREARALRKYIQQRNNAKKRGIAWEISLTDWWRAWQESGNWERRGKGAADYAMCRHGDIGPYSADNVYIATQSKNSADMQRNVKLRGGARKSTTRRFWSTAKLGCSA